MMKDMLCMYGLMHYVIILTAINYPNLNDDIFKNFWPGFLDR